MVKIKPFRASSLVEIIVALLIVSLGIGLSLTVFFNNTSLARLGLKQKCNFEMEYILNPANKLLLIPSTHHFRSFVIQHTVSARASQPGLAVVELKAFTLNGQFLWQRKQLVFVPALDVP